MALGTLAAHFPPLAAAIGSSSGRLGPALRRVYFQFCCSTVADKCRAVRPRLTSWAGSTFSYDLNGNLTGDGTNTYSWDARNQLSSISGGVSASFGYDARGRRRTKTIGSTQTGFVFDGLNFVQELTGSTVNANLLTGGIDEVFQRKEGSTTRYPVTDALGSVIALSDGTGALATTYSFEPYGKTTVSGAVDNNSQAFTGREDDGTGLFYYRARYYMPGCGRFISEDPIGIAAGPNAYAYVNGNPINGFDPLGLDDWWRTPSWRRLDDAAEAGTCRALNQPYANTFEYGNWLIRNPDGTFGFMDPGNTSFQRDWVRFPPRPDNAVGHFHTHPGEDARPGDNDFSPDDRKTVDAPQSPFKLPNGNAVGPAYLGNPLGDVKKYSGGGGPGKNIGSCNNSAAR